jgi:hypothetical protein
MDGQLVRVDLEGDDRHLDGFKGQPKRIEVDPNGWCSLPSPGQGEKDSRT